MDALLKILASVSVSYFSDPHTDTIRMFYHGMMNYMVSSVLCSIFGKGNK